MRIVEVSLGELYPACAVEGMPPRLQAFLHMDSCAAVNDRRYPSVIVCPGGAYRGLAPHEAEPVAMAYYQAGFNAFVLYYSCMPHAYFPLPVLQAAAAVDLVRTNPAWNGNGQVAIGGFSAGGHLSAYLGCHWKDALITEKLGKGSRAYRPDATVLCYAALPVKGETVLRCMSNYTQSADPMSMDIPTAVDADTVPAFLWQTMDDTTVLVEGALDYIAAMHGANVSVEAHLFPNGPHGLSLGTQDIQPERKVTDPNVSAWHGLSVAWLRGLFAKLDKE